MSPLEKQVMTEAEYLAFERASEIKHEFLDGEVFAMAGASRAHNLICSYAMINLGNQLQDQPCEIYPGDMRVKVAATGLQTYPDISVVCGDAQLVQDEFDTLLNPVLIIEVLSSSTERYDRGKKFWHYRQLESLREYVLIAQDSPHIERFLRQDDNTWVLTDVSGLDASLRLASIAAVLSLAAVYEKVTFEQNDDSHEIADK
jgi:Uma2 family endonuclease